MSGELKIFAGSSHPKLANAIAQKLGMALGPSRTTSSANENLEVQILANVRESDVFYIQTAASPLHRHTMEMFLALDALRGASARRVTAVIPYMPYVRADQKNKPRISIAARLMADLMMTSGADRVLTMDLHAPQVQGFFRIPTDQLQACQAICDHLKRRDLSNTVLVAADAGEATDVGRYANRLNLPIAVIDQRFLGKGKGRQMDLIGSVEGKQAILIDDEIATGQTVIRASEFLIERGASSVMACATHGVFCGDCLTNLEASPLTEIVVTDTIPVDEANKPGKVKVLSVAGLFARAIQRIHDGNSVSALFR